MALARLTSFSFGEKLLTLTYANSQTYYVSYAHLVAFELDPRTTDPKVYIYTHGETSETLFVSSSDLVALGSSISAFLASLQGVMVNQLFWFEIWANFLARAKANSALTPELASTCGRYFRYELNPPLVPTATEDYADFWYFNQRCDNDSATVKEASAYNCLLTRFSALNPN
jgi:hypothetical protein